MKVKKARKRLRQVEDLLTTVLEDYSTRQQKVQAFLDTAKTAVAGALTSLPQSPKKPPAREEKSRQKDQRAAKKGVSSTDNKRLAAAKTAAAG